jgi:CAAX protease family protein
MRPDQSRGVAAYLLFTFALSSVFYFLIAKSGQVGRGWGAYIGCLMWCPGVAALLSCKYLGRDLSTLGWKWGKTRYEIACYLIPLGYADEALGKHRLVFLLYCDDHSRSGLRYCTRGGNRLARISCTGACQTTQLRCDCHHFGTRLGRVALSDFLLADGYSGGTPVWYYLPLFTLLLPAISFVWTWMRLKSGSIRPGVVLHAAHNTFIQQFFDPLTVDKSRTRYIAGEFGAGLAAISILMAFYFWKRQNEVTPAAGTITEVASGCEEPDGRMNSSSSSPRESHSARSTF